MTTAIKEYGNNMNIVHLKQQKFETKQQQHQHRDNK